MWSLRNCQSWFVAARAVIKIKDHEYRCERLAIGGTLPAFLFCYYNSVPNLYIELRKPFPFDKACATNQQFGETKREALGRLGFALSIAGLAPVAGTTKIIRVLGENRLEAYSDTRRIKIRFNELIIFDETGIQNLPKVTKSVTKKYKVYDWLFAKQGKKHEHRLFKTDDNFVKEVIFYPSFKRGASPDWYDPVAISYMSETQLRDVNYGENLAR